MLDHSLQDIEAWVLYFSDANLPVLRHTVRRLEEARQNLDRVSGREISRIVLEDPLMAVKVLAYIQPYTGKKLHSDITTIASAIMMLGIEPFFQRFEKLATIENALAGEPQALLGVLQVIRRAQRAARYADDWARWRHDLDVEEVTLAALLHDLAEVLLWTFAPRLAMEIRDRQAADRSLRSVSAQEQVLGVRLGDLQSALCRTWHLPELLLTLIHDTGAENPRVQNVALAVNLARHSANGWDDAALPDDFKAIEALLHIGHDALLSRLGVPVAEPPPDAADAAAGNQPQ